MKLPFTRDLLQIFKSFNYYLNISLDFKLLIMKTKWPKRHTMNEIEKQQKTEKHTYTVQGKTDKAPAVNDRSFLFLFCFGFLPFYVFWFWFFYCYIVGDIVSLAFCYLFFRNLIEILVKLLFFYPIYAKIGRIDLKFCFV